MRPTASTPPSPVTAAGSSENDGEGGRVLVRGKEVDRQRQHRRCLVGPPESQGRREGRTEGDERTEGDR